MKQKVFGLIIIILLFTIHSKYLYGQKNLIRFGRLTVEDGLSNGTVFCICQDTRGYLWFGTREGINRYDGYDFKVYKNIPDNMNSISSNIISCITEDSNGYLWVGTYFGLNRFDYDKELFMRYAQDSINENSLRENYITCISEDNSLLWVSTHDGINSIDINSLEIVTYKNNDASELKFNCNAIETFLIDKKHNFWLGTSSNGLAHFSPEQNSFIYYKDTSFMQFVVSAIFEDSQNNIWVGTNHGLKLFDPKNRLQPFSDFSHFGSDENSERKSQIRGIQEDKNQNLFVVSHYGLSVFNPKTKAFNRYTHKINDKYSITANEIWSAYKDKSGVIWFGTYKGGVSMFIPSQTAFKHWKYAPNNKKSLSNNSIMAFAENTDSTLWIGADHGGLMLFDRDSGLLEHYKHNIDDTQSLSHNAILSLLNDSRGDLWIGTYGGGLNKFNKNTKTFTRFVPDWNNPHSINSMHIWNICEDSKGRIWLSTFNSGVERYDVKTDKFVNYNSDNTSGGVLDNTTWVIFEDSKNNIWVGTNSGLCLFDESKDSFVNFVYDEKRPILSNSSIFVIFEDSKNNLWLGTTVGLYLYSDKRQSLKNITVKDGLINNIINGILEDDSGNLWISTNKGISKCNYIIKNDTLITRIQNFDLDNGLQSNKFNQNSYLKSITGELFFGGVKGFNFFHPDSVKINSYKPPVVITDFKIFNKSVLIGEYDSLLRKNISETTEIILNHKLSVFSFSFAALNYSNPQKNKYEYILEGFDKEWNYCTAKRRFATYTNIPSGEYYFKVKGSNNDGVWNDKYKSIKITILPPWWETWWFITIVILFVTGLITSIYFIRMMAIRERNRVLKSLVEIRTMEVVNQKEKILDKNTDLQKQKCEIEEKNSILNLQKEELQLTLENLKSTQSQLIHAEKLASLGQLIAGIAHEINTPLGAIKASIGTIIIETQNSFKNLPQVLNRLTPDLQELLFELTNEGDENYLALTSREERKQRRELRKKLEVEDFENADDISDKLVDIGFKGDINRYFPLFRSEHSTLIIDTAYSLSEQRKNSLNIQEAIKRVSKIVFALKNFSRQVQSDEKTKADVSNGIDTVLTLYQNQLKHNIEVIKQYDKIPEIYCYPDELNQVWSNIIHNALHAMKGNGQLVISTGLHVHNILEVRIKDSGEGMSPEVKARIFDPFYTTKPTGEGSGLGLDIVSKIIMKHEGKIEVKSKQGEGTEFIILLPVN